MSGPWDAFQPAAPKGGPWEAYSANVPAPGNVPVGTTQGSEPDIGYGQAAATGAVQGATANLADEFYGVLSAGGGKPLDIGMMAGGPGAVAGKSLAGLARLGYEALRGEPGEATKAYETARDKWRSQVKTSEEQYPGTTTAGNVAGAVAAPVGRALQAATLGGRMIRGAAVGAGYGGLAGFGEGEGAADSATKSASGAAIGGVAGGLAAPIIEGGAKLAGAIVSKPVNMVRSALNPDASAQRAIGRAASEAASADPNAVNRLTAQELTAGGPATVMDALGSPGKDLARSAANVSGGARDVLNQTLDPRFEEQAPRLVNWLRGTFHYPDVHAQQQAIEQTAKTVNSGAYARAMHDPAAASLWDGQLQQLTSAPAVQDAIRSATASGANRAAAQGYTPPVNPFQFAADGTMTMKPGVTPSLQFWDQVAKNLGGMIGKAKRAGDDALVNELTPLKTGLLGHIDQIVPSYSQARAGAAHFFGAENALEAGQKFVTENFAVPQTRAALAKMSATEKQLFQDGFVSRYAEMVANVPDRADLVRRIYNSGPAREKIEIALGPQRARELEAMLRVENIMQQSLRAVQGNSTTAMQLIGAGLAGGAGGGWLGFDPTTSGLAAALATAGKKGIDQRVANRVAQLLTSSDPAVLRRGAQAIAGSNSMMNALRIADSSVAKVGGQQSTNVPVLQAAGIGRAEEDQPNVSGPPR